MTRGVRAASDNDDDEMSTGTDDDAHDPSFAGPKKRRRIDGSPTMRVSTRNTLAGDIVCHPASSVRPE